MKGVIQRKRSLFLILKNHIQTVVKHYRGKIYAWDVVNEAFNDDGTLRENIWLKTIGPEYIELTLQWAHEADPHALLFYNDYSNEGLNQKSNAILEMAKDFKNEEFQLMGLDFKCIQILLFNPNYKQIENMKRYSDIGLQVQITEMDVAIQNSKLPYQSRLQAQADMYARTLDVCLSSSNCTAFITWGVADNYSWIIEHSGNEDAPLLFDEHYDPKPSYKSVYKKIQEKSK